MQGLSPLFLFLPPLSGVSLRAVGEAIQSSLLRRYAPREDIEPKERGIKGDGVPRLLRFGR